MVTLAHNTVHTIVFSEILDAAKLIDAQLPDAAIQALKGDADLAAIVLSTDTHSTIFIFQDRFTHSYCLSIDNQSRTATRLATKPELEKYDTLARQGDKNAFALVAAIEAYQYPQLANHGMIAEFAEGPYQPNPAQYADQQMVMAALQILMSAFQQLHGGP